MGEHHRMVEGYRLMNSRTQSGRVASATMHDRLIAWRELLDLCGRKATRKQVHALRVVTLRLQAELGRDLTDLPRASHQAQAILRFGKQAEKLRAELGPVRELDVWIGKLRGLRASLSDTGDYVPRSMHDWIDGIDRLEEQLKQKRINAGKKLLAVIKKRGEHFVAASEEVDGALSEHVFGNEPGIAQELAARFGAVRAEFSTFDEENLHEFRKRIKTVRYLAEIHADADRACAHIAAQMKKVQSAIGEWHDWQELGREALHERHAKNKALAELLHTVTAESFEVAVSTVLSISARLLGEGTAPAKALHIEGRKPPEHSDHSSHTDLDQQLA
jgi:CHAD domain-containing protein